jgi:hypothetical protein
MSWQVYANLRSFDLRESALPLKHLLLRAGFAGFLRSSKSALFRFRVLLLKLGVLGSFDECRGEAFAPPPTLSAGGYALFCFFAMLPLSMSIDSSP